MSNTAQPITDDTRVVTPAPVADTVTALTIYVVLLFAVPSDLRIPALGGAGSLAGLWSLATGLWWCWIHLQRPTSRPSLAVHPVRIAALVLVGAIIASYVTAMVRPIAVQEVSQADIGLLRILSLVSIVLLAADVLPNLDRFRVLLRRFAWLAAGLGALGLAQFVSGRSLVDGITLPGMVSTQPFSAVVDRGGFTRSAGTAMSPLEYGAALSTAMPIALTLALYERHRNRLVRFLPATIIGAALLLSGSRSALLGLAAGVVVMFPVWSAKIRTVAAAAGVIALGAMVVLVPGMLGTLRYLFTSTDSDASAQSRSGSYDLVAEFVERSPLLGRGFGTFLPQYRILDNQYLLLLVEVGVVGLVAFLGLVLTAAACATIARRSLSLELDRQLGQALAAGVMANALLFAFFDALSFPMAAGCLFLMIGLCGGYWRLVRSKAGGSQ